MQKSIQKSSLVCPSCGFKAKNRGGLKWHMMSKEECREAIEKEFTTKSAKKDAGKTSQPSPKGGEVGVVEEELVDEIDLLREILINEGVKRGRENILNSLKRGDIHDLYDLNEIMRERGIRPYKRRDIIRAWADTSELDVPEDLRKDLRMRGRRSRDYGVPSGTKRARRVEELRERKYDRLEDLALKREIKEQQKELDAMEKGGEGKEKSSMTLMPLQQKDGSVTYQPVKLPKEYAAPMMNPFMMNLPQFQRDQRDRGADELRKRFEKLETMMEKMREDREHKAIRDDVHRLTERFERGETEDKGGALREELRGLRTKLDDERYNTLRNALAGKLRELDERTRHNDLDMYSKVSGKLENLGVSGGRKTKEDHEMDLERTEHKKRLDILDRQYRGIQRRVDDIAEVLKPAAKLLVMERVRKEGEKKGRRRVQKKYTPKELESIEKALKKEAEGAKGAKEGKKGKRAKIKKK